jgi:hypothetical protein
MKKYKYIGQLYKQGDSVAKLVTFCAPASDIFTWGGIPQKTDRFDGGFQRALDKRHEKIRKFFESGQASPTSVVIAFREGVTNIQPLSFPNSWPKNDLSETPEFVEITFELDEIDKEETSLDDLIEETKTLLNKRIREEDLNDSEDVGEEVGGEDNQESEDKEDESGPEVENDDEEEENDTIDVGHSKLIAFYRFISDKDKVLRWIDEENIKHEQIRAKSRKTKKEKEYIRDSPEVKLKQTLVSLLRPAMIVDGQHRVNGAYNASTSPVSFNICAIVDADWVEQVFQFVILNKTAKPISKGFLSGLLNTSLTNKEIDDIDERLETIGIKNLDRLILRLINYSPESPFLNEVAAPGEVVGVDTTGKLKDQGMIRLAKTWYSIQNNKNKLKMFYPMLGIHDENNASAQRNWNKDNFWINPFYAFWNVVKSIYEPEGIWEKSETIHLVKIVTFHVLQDYFIQTQESAGNTFDTLEDFAEKVRKFYSPVKATFFKGWSMTGLQSGDGPDYIQKAIHKYRMGAKLTDVIKDETLFKGN